MSQLKIAEVVLEHFNLVNNQYQQDLRDRNTFTLNKSFGKLTEYLPSLFIFLNTLVHSFPILKFLLLNNMQIHQS